MTKRRRVLARIHILHLHIIQARCYTRPSRIVTFARHGYGTTTGALLILQEHNVFVLLCGLVLFASDVAVADILLVDKREIVDTRLLLRVSQNKHMYDMSELLHHRTR